VGSASRLEIRNIVAGYGSAPPVIRDVSLTFNDGNVTTLIGPNGAGKSTLLHCISGLVGLRAGEIILSGTHIGRVPAQTRAGLGVGTCAQGRSNFAHLTVEENLRLAGFKLPRRELRDRLHRLRSDDPLLHERWQDRLGDLSGGQQQFVEISMVLMNDPQVLLLDEPSLGLSPAARSAIFSRARSIADQGRCIVVVEQNVRAATAITDQLVVLDRGTIALQGKPTDILANPVLRAVYVGDRVQQGEQTE
jgi:branched-chain amino acid transport system ATP-binding protein